MIQIRWFVTKTPRPNSILPYTGNSSPIGFATLQYREGQKTSEELNKLEGAWGEWQDVQVIIEQCQPTK